MVKIRLIDLFETNNFVFNIVWPENGFFDFVKKPFLMDKTRTVGQKWLPNEIDLHFLTFKKCTKGQSNRSILSKVTVLKKLKSTDRQTHSRKPFFRVQRVSKRGHLTKTGGHKLHKSNTFSDENVKI